MCVCVCVAYAYGFLFEGEGVTVASGLIVLNSIVLPHKDLVANVANEIIL